jgi:hypothetical protein
MTGAAFNAQVIAAFALIITEKESRGRNTCMGTNRYSKPKCPMHAEHLIFKKFGIVFIFGCLAIIIIEALNWLSTFGSILQKELFHANSQTRM